MPTARSTSSSSPRAQPRLREVVEAQLDRLSGALDFPEAQRVRLRRLTRLLTAGALERPARPPFPGLSAINADGLPFQWSVAVGGKAPSVRFLCERGPLHRSAPERLAALRAALPEVCTLAGLGALPALESLMSDHLIPSAAAWPRHWRSAMWTGVGATADRIGLKAYFNLTAGTPEARWRRVGRVLQASGRHRSLERLCACSGPASRDSWPVGLSIDLGPSAELGPFKVYFRSGAVDPAWIARWYDAWGQPGSREPIRLLLETLAPPTRQAYPEGSFVVSLEFPETDGPPALKIEVELTRWISTELEAVAKVRRLLRGLGLAEQEYLAFLDALGASRQLGIAHRLVGVRSDPSGQLRVNVYLSPPLPEARPRPVPWPRAGGIPAALRWLDASRGSVGQGWSDYRLPVGVADCWTTAYVSCLLSLAEARCEGVRGLAAEGRDWLEARRHSAAWGYNETTADDADSTALALLALRRGGRPLPAEPQALLRSCLRPDGGVATYPGHVPPGGAWAESTADVTPAAIEALSPARDSTMLREALASMLARQRADGLWDSYWWTTPLYASWWAARVFGRLLPVEPRRRLESGVLRWRPAGAFEQALQALAFVELGACDAARAVALNLSAAQHADGSWSPSAWLRLSRAECRAPWREIDAGPCFVDERRVFTTATALTALVLAGAGPLSGSR